MNLEGTDKQSFNQNFCSVTETTDKLLRCETKGGINGRITSTEDIVKAEVSKIPVTIICSIKKLIKNI